MSNRRAKIGTVFIIFASAIFSGCFSVDTLLAPPAPKKADGLVLNPPKNNFKEIKNSTVDQAWQNSKNGNTIAYLSECFVKADIPLKTIEEENLEAMTNIEVVEDQDTTYNDREALFSTVNGKVDGVDVRLRLILFKKNSCTYTLSYVGRTKYFLVDENAFKTFVEDFKAP